ncbi:hypothetical protein KY289_032912 [Solanum tuberosum]|nr:hypothetical protein KY289_032912 [Solanum tuberosum]
MRDWQTLKSVSIEREGLSELTDESGSIVVLPVSAESAGLLPKRVTGAKGSDIVLEAILEADVAKNAKEFLTATKPIKNCRNDKCGGGIVNDKDGRLISFDAVMSKITSASQLVDESGESPTWVGLGRHVYIYGLGSQAVFYENVGSSSASTSQPQDCSFDAQVKEYVQEMKEEMKHEMRGDERIDTT